MRLARYIPFPSAANALRAAALAAVLPASLFAPRPARAQQTPDAAADPVLARARDLTAKFFDEFSLLRYDEHILQQKMQGEKKVLYKQESLYDSLYRVHYDEGLLRVSEQRLPERVPSRKEKRPLLLSSGFSALALIFHPSYESSFRFTRIEDGVLRGKPLARYRFEHVRGAPSPILYQTTEVERPLELSGTAWVDPDSGMVFAIQASVGDTMEDLGLKELRVEIFYGSMSLQDEQRPQWLPITAIVDLETPHQHWRNVHRFDDYRRYRVDVTIGQGTTP